MRNSAFVTSVVAIAAIVLGVRFSQREPKGTKAHTTWSLVTVAGLSVAFFSVPLVLFRQYQMALVKQLARGERVRARWTVSAGQWEEFQTLSRRWDQVPGHGLNEIDVNQAAAPGGIAVVVGEQALQVGGDFHGVGTQDGVQVHDGWIEINKWLASDEPGGRTVYYRWPFPPDAKEAVSQFSQHR